MAEIISNTMTTSDESNQVYSASVWEKYGYSKLYFRTNNYKFVVDLDDEEPEVNIDKSRARTVFSAQRDGDKVIVTSSVHDGEIVVQL